MATDNTTTTETGIVLSEQALDAVAAPRTYTLANGAKGVEAACKSDDKALAYLAGVRKFVGSRTGETAVAAAHAIKVGKARGWKQGEIAKDIGVSASMATLYVRLGAAYEKGVEPGSETWKALMGKGYANAADVSKVIMDESKTADDVETAVAAHVRALGGSGSEDSSDSSGSGNGANNGNTVEVPRGFKQKVAHVEACIAGFPAKPTDAQMTDIEALAKTFAAYARSARAARKADAA